MHGAVLRSKPALAVLALLLLVPGIGRAWKWPTHRAIAQKAYACLPDSVKVVLPSDLVLRGSVYPDSVLRDTRNHSWPKAYDKATAALGKASAFWHSRTCDSAALYLGIAAHYISDDFTAPHCVSGEKSSDHARFERRANSLSVSVGSPCAGTDMEARMRQGYEEGLADWTCWLRSSSATDQDRVILQELSMSAAEVALDWMAWLSSGTEGRLPAALQLGTPAPAPLSPSRVSEGRYVASRNSDGFHYPSCPAAQRILPENRVWFGTRHEALDAGYVPCRRCRP